MFIIGSGTGAISDAFSCAYIVKTRYENNSWPRNLNMKILLHQ